MRPERVKEDGRVFEITCELERDYLSAKYSLSKEDAILSPTGGLRIFTLKPISGHGPWFSGRWDGGTREVGGIERHDLDVDIGAVSPKEKNWFKHGKHGYSGHSPNRVSGVDGWYYRVFITIPTDIIFKGSVRLYLHRKISFIDSFQLREP